jgi:hypothetical protein
LVIDRRWSVDPSPLAAQQDMIDSEILEYFIGLSSDTIVTLHLKFVDYFSLYIQDIGRIQNLRDLHLDISATPSGEQHLQMTNPANFNNLMVATRGLKSLNLHIHISLPEVPEPGLWKDQQYMSITHLHMNVVMQEPTGMLRWALACKSSLTMLSIEDNWPGLSEELFAGYA